MPVIPTAHGAIVSAFAGRVGLVVPTTPTGRVELGWEQAMMLASDLYAAAWETAHDRGVPLGRINSTWEAINLKSVRPVGTRSSR